MKRTRLYVAIASMLVAASADAALERVGPVDQLNGGYPAWYQDKTGLTLDFGKPLSQGELNGGWLLILPANVPNGTFNEVPFTNYSAEHFYWNATAGSKQQGGMSLVLSLEGAFASNVPAANDQIVFGRLRFKIASAVTAGDYKVYTPYGVLDFPGVSVGDKIFHTQDVGITCGTNFSCALDSLIGPFLLPSAYPGGSEVPPVPTLVKGSGVDPYYDALAAATADPGTGRKYVADPARIGPLTGGTCALTPGKTPATAVPGDCVTGNAVSDPPDGAGGFLLPARPVYMTSGGLRDPNMFRVEVNGVEVPSAAPGEWAFTTAGRVFEAPIAGRITVNRVSYGQAADGTGKKLDVFVTATPSMNPRLPASGAPAITSNPDMGYWDTACGTDAAGNPIAPTANQLNGVALSYFQMMRSSPTSSTWWGQNAPVDIIPTQVCVLDNGRAIPSYTPAPVADEVDILAATYQPSLAALVVDAVTSDCFTHPTLVLDGYGPLTANTTACTNTISVPMLAPPHRVSVTSVRGGVASMDVRTLVGMPVVMNAVVTNADFQPMPEDCSPAPASSCAVPPAFDVLGNDTYTTGGVTGPVPAGATVAITTVPANGVATLDASNRIVYTPKPNFNGAELIGYKVTYLGVTSNEGYLHVNVQPVNDAPTAVADAIGVPNNKSITVNLLANDTDPDGAADLASAVIQSLPAAGVALQCPSGTPAAVGTACAGGSLTVSATGGAGVYTFTYSARDQAGATSAPASVTVTVNATENIVVTKSIFTSKSWRWTVTGTDSSPSGQTVTITYDITTPPTYKVGGVCTAMTAATNPVIGTAVVDALGNWSYDTSVTSAGVVNPTNTGSNGTGFWCSPPKSIRISTPNVAVPVTTNIQFK